MRTPMFGTRLPRYRTRSGAFDDMVAAQIRRLNGAWPQLVKPVQFAVEDVPPSQPAPWEPEPSFASQCFPASHGIPPASCCTACRYRANHAAAWIWNWPSAMRWCFGSPSSMAAGRMRSTRIGACKALSGETS